jgi:O-antigen biosynthesis protein
LNVSVVILTYAAARLPLLTEAIASVRSQRASAAEVVVVVDGNRELHDEVVGRFPGVTTVLHSEPRGTSGARNTGIRASSGDLIAFLDDDAVADPDWLAQLRRCFDDDAVMVAAGLVVPAWSTGRPPWFPEEFDWVVGCSYRGQAGLDRVEDWVGDPIPVRNAIGAGMMIRRRALDEVGPFRPDIGRIGPIPVGGDETELCMRIAARYGAASVVLEPRAVVRHQVPSERVTLGYFHRRCHAEGLTKAALGRMMGTQRALSSESRYLVHTLPKAIGRGLSDTARGDADGLARSAAVVGGTLVAALGWLTGTLRGRHEYRGSTHGNSPNRPSGPEPTNGSTSFRRTRILQADVAEPLPVISPHDERGGPPYERALLLVRLHTEPIGLLDLDLHGSDLPPEAYVDRLWSTFATRINDHLARDGRPPLRSLDPAGLPAGLGGCHVLEARAALLRSPPFASVVVCTRDRPEQLRSSLEALLAQAYPAYEIVVVDNAPTSTATHELVARLTAEHGARLRYVREDRAGLSRARNQGLLHAGGEIVAYTDDDVVPDPHWLAELVKGFQQAPDVACVTGLTLPAELEAPAQAWFEQFGGFGLGFTGRTYRAGDAAGDRSPGVHLLPYAAGQYGSGNNMAFKADFLRSIGGFDPALGPGTVAQGGEDLAALFQVIDGGHALRYEPRALIFHIHRRTFEELVRQVRAYGVGLAAYLTKVIVDRPRRVLGLVGKLPLGVVYLLDPRSSKNRNKSGDFPPGLTRTEAIGMLYGPIAYARSALRLRRR